MNETLQNQPRQLLPLVLLHTIAAGACFSFFAAVPIGGCLLLMAVENDMGGPMFFPFLIVGALIFAFVATAGLIGASLLSNSLRRRYYVPPWAPPLAVFIFGLLLSWINLSAFHFLIPVVMATIITSAFIVYWAAVSKNWFLPKILFKFFGNQQTSCPTTFSDS